jgi:PAS domain S-box-containing protein
MDKRSKILVVNGDPVVVRTIQRTLKTAEYGVMGAGDGETALKMTRQGRPNLVLLDVNVQGMNGLEVCRQIKDDPDLAGVYVIILSSKFNDIEKQELRLESGADGFLTHPVSNPELLAYLQSILRAQAAEKAVRASEKRYRDLFDNASLAIFQVTVGGKPLLVNPEFVRMFGYASSDDFFTIVKDTASLFANPRRRTEILRLKTKNPNLTSFENIYRRKDGTTFTGHLTMREVKGSDGRTEYLQGVIEDITARRQAEESENKIERQYRQLIEQAAEGIFIILPQGNFILVNSKTCEMLGYTEQELLRLNILDTYLPEMRSEGKKRLAGLRAGVHLQFERPMLRKNGSMFMIEATTAVLEDGTIQSIIRDITERKHSDEAVKLSEARYRSLVETQAEVISRSDTSGALSYVNDSFCSTFGIPREQALGISFGKTVIPEDLPIILQAMEAIKQAPYRKYIEIRNLTPDGVR